MLAKLHTACLVLCALLLGAALSACGGGGGGAGGGAAPPASTLTFDYKYTGLVGSPSFAISSVSINNTGSGTVTLVSGGVTDVVGYALNTATGLITTTSAYTVQGDLAKGWLMVCKPLDSVNGSVSGQGSEPKSIYVAMPSSAVAGTSADATGKTFDFYQDCKTTINVTYTAELLDTTATVALFSQNGRVVVNTNPSRTATDRLSVYTADSKVFLVSRTVETPPIDNQWGAIGLWVSR